MIYGNLWGFIGINQGFTGIYRDYGDSIQVSVHGGTPSSLDGLSWKFLLKWIMTGGSQNLGNVHIIIGQCEC